MKKQHQKISPQESHQFESGIVKRLTFNKWFDRFKPIRNQMRKDAPHGCLFDTFGPELERVKVAPNNTIWSLSEIDWDTIIIPGLHLGRLGGHFICQVPWSKENLQIFYPLYRFLTPESKDAEEEEKWKLELGAKCNRLLDFAEVRENSPRVADQQLAADLRAIIGRVRGFEDLMPG